MKYLVIGIRTDPELFVTSTHVDLQDENDEITAQRAIERHMNCEADRVLIVSDVPHTKEEYDQPAVVNDFNAHDLPDENELPYGENE